MFDKRKNKISYFTQDDEHTLTQDSFAAKKIRWSTWGDNPSHFRAVRITFAVFIGVFCILVEVDFPPAVVIL